MLSNVDTEHSPANVFIEIENAERVAGDDSPGIEPSTATRPNAGSFKPPFHVMARANAVSKPKGSPGSRSTLRRKDRVHAVYWPKPGLANSQAPSRRDSGLLEPTVFSELLAPSLIVKTPSVAATPKSIPYCNSQVILHHGFGTLRRAQHSWLSSR